MASDVDQHTAEIYPKFKKARFNLDFGESITAQHFIEYFNSKLVPEALTQIVYKSIESADDNRLTQNEFFQWQRRKCKRPLIAQCIMEYMTALQAPSPPESKEDTSTKSEVEVVEPSKTSSSKPRVPPPTGHHGGQHSVGISQSYDFDGILSDYVEEHPDFEDAPLSAVDEEEETVDIAHSDPLKS